MATTPWQIRLRRDYAAQWLIKNPILSMDEVGLERDTRKFKVGNGITPWKLLPYGSVTGPTSILVFVSDDPGNALRYGTDGGLFVPETDMDLLADYLIGRL